MLSNHPKVRVTIYVIGVAAQIASFFVTIFSPDLAQAFSQTSDVLATIALGTALTNISDVTGRGSTTINYTAVHPHDRD